MVDFSDIVVNRVYSNEHGRWKVLSKNGQSVLIQDCLIGVTQSLSVKDWNEKGLNLEPVPEGEVPEGGEVPEEENGPEGGEVPEEENGPEGSKVPDEEKVPEGGKVPVEEKGPLETKQPVKPYTIGRFQDINFQPVSVFEFVSGKKRTFLVLVGLLCIIFIVFLCVRFQGFDIEYIESQLGDFIGASFYLLLICLYFVHIFKLFARYKNFEKNAQYVEIPPMKGSLCRIAMNGKLGLYDKKSRRVLLVSEYDRITIFDSSHILLEVGDKKGIYSIRKKYIIIPPIYDRIDAFSNSISAVYKGIYVYHYDINGNKMD